AETAHRRRRLPSRSAASPAPPRLAPAPRRRRPPSTCKVPEVWASCSSLFVLLRRPIATAEPVTPLYRGSTIGGIGARAHRLGENLLRQAFHRIHAEFRVSVADCLGGFESRRPKCGFGLVHALEHHDGNARLWRITITGYGRAAAHDILA